MAEDCAVVVIGRNEGARLERCFRSLGGFAQRVYVDSGSTDNSVQLAKAAGFELVSLNNDTRAFSAARARNAGFDHLNKIGTVSHFVQFVDGDCEIDPRWPETASMFLRTNPQIAAVCGKLYERDPDRSIYNWLCDREWEGPAGQILSFAGNVMIRAKVFQDANGYREDLIAGEESELALRIRGRGWLIWRLDADMATHDADMHRFSQWWRRAVRSGYAFAQGAYVHGASPERHFVRESVRAWAWAVVLPLVAVVGTLIAGPICLLLLLLYPLQILRLTLRPLNLSAGKRFWLAYFQTLSRFAEAVGQIRFIRDWAFDRRALLIEHK